MDFFAVGLILIAFFLEFLVWDLVDFAVSFFVDFFLG